MEGMRTIVFAKDGKSTLEADDKGAGRAEDAAFPSNFVRVSKYSSYLMLLLSFTFTDFFLQVSGATSRPPPAAHCLRAAPRRIPGLSQGVTATAERPQRQGGGARTVACS